MRAKVDDTRRMVPTSKRGPCERKTAGQLLDPEARDRPGDDQLLDLLGAFEDVVGLAKPFGQSTRVRDLRFLSTRFGLAPRVRGVLVPE
jgi:hypothetical protein